MLKEKSAGAILFIQENGNVKYLLLHYQSPHKNKKKSGHWDFSKGHIEPGETDEQTVRREVEEETGIKDIEIIPGFKEKIRYFFRVNYHLPKEKKNTVPWTNKMVIFFLARTNQSNVTISPEHVGFEWLSYEEARKRLTYKNAKELLKKANSFLTKDS